MLAATTKLADNPEPEKQGGYLTAIQIYPRIISLQCQIGVVHPEKRDEYRGLSMKGASRLLAHPTHASSWQSRDHANKRWGGAIRSNNWVFSLSGPPEKMAEAVVTAVSYHLQLIIIRDVDFIASLSDNPSIRTLLSLNPAHFPGWANTE